MKILVIGSGAREHAIVWKLAQSPKVDKIYCAPGNAGIAAIAECIQIKNDDIMGLLSFALEKNIDLTVVGPEAPLTQGIVDSFLQKGLRIFGPNKQAAHLEGSKAFAKEFMEKYNIPTAKYKAYEDFDKAIEEIDQFGMPVVIKADGLAAGKGVIIADNKRQAAEAILEIMGQKLFGEAGKTIVMEEYLEGKEVSILAFVDGNSIVPMVSAQDYKRALDGDAGLNTGGMGAVSPALYYSRELEKIIHTEILNKTFHALQSEGIKYKGVLYFGLMLTAEGPKVLEFNVRFGDPETEAILPRLESDLSDIFNAVVDGRLSETEIKWSQKQAVCVVMASGGYPEEYQTGCEISGLPADSEAVVFHAGTKSSMDKLVTAGGRVLVASALGEDFENARTKAYQAVSQIHFKDMQYRKDIGIK